MKRAALTAQQLHALELVADGADIYARAIAATLRKLAPRYVTIVKPQRYRGTGIDQVPYFGAIATAEGRRVLRRAEAAK